MRSLVNDAFRISTLQYAGHMTRRLASGGRCRYHDLPIRKIIDNQTSITVNVGIGMSIDVCVRQPPRPEPNNPIIIFLGPGIPTAVQTRHHLKNLALGANAVAVEIMHRVSAQNSYPVPIHSVLAGYDWVRAKLASGPQGYQDLTRITKPSRIGVCGELVGGSLATMLALTECSSTPTKLERQSISALAVGNPILDWTALTRSDATGNISQGASFRKIAGIPDGANNESLSINSLCDIRELYFSKAEGYSDPFASPLLFFRTPTSEIPIEAAAPTEHGLLDGGSEDRNPPSPSVKKRRWPRKYPPTGSNLLLPGTMVEVGEDFVLKDQGVELVEMMQKSFKRSKDESTGDAKNTVRRDFELVEREGMGLWEEKHTFKIGQWFGEQLRKP